MAANTSRGLDLVVPDRMEVAVNDSLRLHHWTALVVQHPSKGFFKDVLSNTGVHTCIRDETSDGWAILAAVLLVLHHRMAKCISLE